MERHVYPFGSALVVAVLVTGLIFAIKAVVPGLEELAEERFGHAWLYMGVLALIVFFVFGLMPLRFASSERAGLEAGNFRRASGENGETQFQHPILDHRTRSADQSGRWRGGRLAHGGGNDFRFCARVG